MGRVRADSERRERIGLVGCVKSKTDRPAAAKDLYTSPLFRGRRRWVEHRCDRWFILSARHGLVEPSRRLLPYDVTLKDVSSKERREWSLRVLMLLHRIVGDHANITVEIHAGSLYRDYGLVDGLQERGVVVEVPTAGLGIGEQLSFYASSAPS